MVHFGFSGLSGYLKPMDCKDLYEHDEYWSMSGYDTSSLDYKSCFRSGDMVSFVLERDEAD